MELLERCQTNDVEFRALGKAPARKNTVSFQTHEVESSRIPRKTRSMLPTLRSSIGVFLFSILLLAFAGCSSLSLEPNRFASQAASANRDDSRIEKALRELCQKGMVEF